MQADDTIRRETEEKIWWLISAGYMQEPDDMEKAVTKYINSKAEKEEAVTVKA